MKKIFSIILIFIFLTMSAIIIPVCNSGYFAYADSQLTDEQKAELAFSTYVNYRSGWFTSSSNVSVIGLLKTYIDDYFVSEANTTSIKNYSDFASEITVATNSSGNWYVKISDEGINFLDHLCKYLLGKSKFPNLYSNGSWGTGATVDSAYHGLIYGQELFFYVKEDLTNLNFTNYVATNVTEGSPADGWTVENMIRFYNNNKTNSLLVSFDNSLAVSGGDNAGNVSLTVDYYSGISLTKNLLYTRNSTYTKDIKLTGEYAPYCPYLRWELISASTIDRLKSIMVYNSAGYGVPCRFAFQNNASTTTYYGFVFHDTTDNKYYFSKGGQATRTSQTAINDSDVDLKTNDFNKNDLSNGNEREFTPQHSADQGSSTIYNYYNNETYNTENEFYTTYITNYRNQHTIIESPDPEEPDDPDPTPLPTPSNDSGSITPDGNGGYTFNLPDVGIPNFNGFNWSINGLSEKFPFSIPFDLLAFFTVLNAEPETPEIQATIPLGLWEWDIDWNLHNFDNLAALLRNLEFIGFCIALILITRRLIKG